MIFPEYRRSRDEGVADVMPVLVPGLFGLGMVISLLVLAADLLAKVVPSAKRRRRALEVRDARGRERDFSAIATGTAPESALLGRVPRRRGVAAGIGLVSLGAAAVALGAGFAVASGIGADREAWAIGTGLAFAAPLTLFGLVWILGAVLGPLSPPWLSEMNASWPLGTYPDFDPNRPQEG